MINRSVPCGLTKPHFRAQTVLYKYLSYEHMMMYLHTSNITPKMIWIGGNCVIDENFLGVPSNDSDYERMLVDVKT